MTASLRCMDTLDAQLHQLVAEICQHSRHSLERRRGLNQLIGLIQRSGKVWRGGGLLHSEYDDALQQTWLYFCRNLCEAATGQAYNPTQASVITWLNAYLRCRLQDRYQAMQVEKSRTAYRPLSNTTEALDPLENLPAPAVPLPILQEVQEWVNRESRQLRRIYVRDRPDINCQVLILRRLPPETSWEELVRIILQTEDIYLRRLPWHLWDLFDRYPRAEIALSAPTYGRVQHLASANAQVKILAILGSSEGINVQADEYLLRQLPNSQITFLVEPKRKQLNDQLWEQGWDILFFAGHSSSQANGQTGRIYINDRDSLTTVQLRYALKRAVEKGLKIAILNSCDGLGLARELADLQIPQIIVMREPVPDQVAQEFLKSFLKAFSRGEPLYLAIREARQRLQGMEDQFPYATWLPMICQNPAETPPHWSAWGGYSHAAAKTSASNPQRSRGT